MSALSPRQMFNLDLACSPIAEAFAATPYLVGSALDRGERPPRDIDVRLILDDGQHDSLRAILGREGMAFLGIALGQYLAAHTGLPVDFQIQRATEANERHRKPRNPLGGQTLGQFSGDAGGDQ